MWPKTDAAAFYSRCMQTDVGEIPGCKLSEFSLEVPYTAWSLASVEELLEALGAQVPTNNETRFRGISQPAQWGERTLYDYQRDGVDFAITRTGSIIADEMGLGKSSQAAVAAELVRRQYAPRPALIIGTLAVQQTWRRELQLLGLASAENDLCVLEGRDFKAECFVRHAKWYFVHYEVVKAWWSIIYRVRPCVVIIDEAHYIRNSKTQRSTGAMLATAGAHRKILLTGTPLENRASDLWNPLTVACGARTWGYASQFRARYCGAVHDGYKLVDQGPTNVAELRHRLSEVYLRRTTADANLDLPVFTRTQQLATLGAAQKEYNAVVENLQLFELGTLESLVRAIAEGLIQKVLPELTRLRQITSRAKVQATRDYVINALEQEESLVVFTWERETATMIYNGLGSYTKFLAHGGVTQGQRDKFIDAFQGSKEPAVLVTTYGAMREGVTLHKARICVLHDLEWILSSMLQAEKRVHRIGQKFNCQAVWMLAAQSMDTLVAPILLRKAALMEEILGIKHDISSDVGLTELAGRMDADALIAQTLANWGGAIQND